MKKILFGLFMISPTIVSSQTLQYNLENDHLLGDTFGSYPPPEKTGPVIVEGLSYSVRAIQARLDVVPNDALRVTVTPHSDDNILADVEFYNTLTTRNEPSEHITFTVDGYDVVILLTFRQGPISDEMEVIPPDGFYAEPRTVKVEEYESGTVRIYMHLLG